MRTAQNRDQYRKPLKNSMLALFTASCATLAVTSCSGGSGGAEAKPSATKANEKPSPTASADPQASGKKEVLDAYGKFWAAQTKAYAQASAEGTDLKKYATADALSRAEGDIASMKKLGVVTNGEPRHDANVTALALEKKVPAATITDCLDISHWKQVEKKTGKEMPRGKKALGRYVTVVSAEKWGKQWMILKVDTQQRSC